VFWQSLEFSDIIGLFGIQCGEALLVLINKLSVLVIDVYSSLVPIQLLSPKSSPRALSILSKRLMTVPST